MRDGAARRGAVRAPGQVAGSFAGSFAGGLDGCRLTAQFNHMVKSVGSTRRRPAAREGTKGKGRAVPPVDDRDTRDRILDAAHRVFVLQGTAKARTQEIADEAGVNKALVHYYFGTKDALAGAVFAAAITQFMPRIFGILGSETMTIEEKVRAVVREQVDFHFARPYLSPYLVTEAHTEPERVRSIMQQAGPAPLGVLRRQLAEAASAGEMRRISAEQFVVSLIGLLVFPFLVRPMLEVIVGLDTTRFSAFVEARKRELPDFFLAGLRP